MNRAVLSLLIAAVSGTSIAHAGVSSTVTATTDYDFRGITQTAQDPALQISLDYEHDSGFYVGAWGSNVDFGDDTGSDVELNWIAGYGGDITEDLGYDLGVTYYQYVPDDDDIDYAEVYAGLSYGDFSTTLWYAPDYVNSSDSAWYLEGNGAVPLPMEFSMVLHLGYNGGDYWDDEDNELDEFYDWSAGIARSVGRFDFELKWADGSDLDELKDTPDDANSSEGRVIFSVSTTFPWTEEE